MPWHDMYFILVKIKRTVTCKYYLAGKINQHGGKYNCIETPVTN